jgi:hypothetical protein
MAGSHENYLIQDKILFTLHLDKCCHRHKNINISERRGLRDAKSKFLDWNE